MGTIFTPTGEIQRGIENGVSPKRTVFEIMGNIRFLRSKAIRGSGSVPAREGVIRGMVKELREMGRRK